MLGIASFAIAAIGLIVSITAFLADNSVHPRIRATLGIPFMLLAILFGLLGFFSVLGSNASGETPSSPSQDQSNSIDSNPPSQPYSTSVIVFANQAWQDTGIAVNPGDVLVIRYASGSWRWTGDRADFDGNGDPYANGSYLEICTTNYDCPVTDAPLEALVGRIGLSGEPFLIGNSITYTIPNSTGNNQKLFLMGNDSISGLHDNVGSIEVSITSR